MNIRRKVGGLVALTALSCALSTGKPALPYHSSGILTHSPPQATEDLPSSHYKDFPLQPIHEMSVPAIPNHFHFEFHYEFSIEELNAYIDRNKD